MGGDVRAGGERYAPADRGRTVRADNDGTRRARTSGRAVGPSTGVDRWVRASADAARLRHGRPESADTIWRAQWRRVRGGILWAHAVSRQAEPDYFDRAPGGEHPDQRGGADPG